MYSGDEQYGDEVTSPLTPFNGEHYATAAQITASDPVQPAPLPGPDPDDEGDDPEDEEEGEEAEPDDDDDSY